MTETGKRANNATISDLGIKNATAHWNLPPEELATISIEKGQATLTSTGAININTGEFTGRSPMDRFIVKDTITEDSVWWGKVNLSFDAELIILFNIDSIPFSSSFVTYRKQNADNKLKNNIK